MTFPVFGGNAAGSGCYVPTGKKLTKSLRFRNSASAYLSRTPSGTATDQQKWTISCWFKRGYNPSYGMIFSSAGYSFLRFGLYGNAIDFDFGAPDSGDRYTNAVYGDYSGWYHMVCVFDSTQANAYDRCQIYINGVLQSYNYGALPAQFSNSYWNTPGYIHTIGCLFNATQFFDGYLAEFYNIDGQALSPTSFGQTDPVTGTWVPINYTGTYGNFGFYLPFTDATSPTTLAQDQSGNGNDWTPNNISTTAGVTYDSMTDVPTLSALASNYATLNPILPYQSNGGQFLQALINGNLTTIATNYPQSLGVSTICVSSGKWYAEFVCTIATDGGVGIIAIPMNYSYYYYTMPGLTMYYTAGTVVDPYPTVIQTYTAWGTGDIIGVALDMDNGELYFSKNGVWQGGSDPATRTNPAKTGLTGTYGIQGNQGSGGTVNANFGQQGFTYTPPTDFLPLNTANLPCPTIWNGANVMAATLYTGNGSTQTISNAANNTIGKTFYPDLTWIKDRTSALDNELVDSVRGATLQMQSNAVSAQSTDANGLTSFGATGFSIGNSANYNTNTDSFVAWQWNAGSGTSASNTNGSITSTVSANPTAGFSIVKYTGTGANATVGHGLGIAPSMMIFKGLNPTNWTMYHSSLPNASTSILIVNSTSGAIGSLPTYWNSTDPTSSVFSLSTDSNVNGISPTEFVAYCWAAIPGYSAFGSYTGNGVANGPFVYTGFRPRYVMIKCATDAQTWVVYDTSRNPYNISSNLLQPNTPDAEAVGNANQINILSNGMQMVSSTAATNTSGQTYIYACFAENPLKYANAR